MTHIVRRSMSLLLAVLFCLSLVTLPVLAIEGEDQPTSTTTESVADPDSGSPTEGDTPTDPTEQSPSTSDGEETPDADKSQDTEQNKDQGEEQNGANSTTEGNGDYKEQEGDSEENNGSPVNPGEGNGEGEEPPATEKVPTGFFKTVKIGKEYNASTEEMTGFAGESNVGWDASCALRFDYVVPDSPAMYAGTEYTFSVEAPLIIATDFNILNERNVVVATGRIEQSSTNPTVANGTLKFKDKDYLAPGVKGHFFVQAMFNKAQNNGTGKQDIKITVTGNISDQIEVDFAAPEAKASVELKKESDAVTMLSDHKIEWTITVTPKMENLRAGDKGRITSLLVTDQIDTKKLTYVSATATVPTTGGGTASAEGQFTYNEESGNLTFEGSGSDLTEASWPITIKVITSYDLANENLTIDSSGNLEFSNSANVKITAPQYVKKEDGTVSLEDPGDDTSGQPKPETANATAKIAYVSFDKTGVLESGNAVTWTITAKNAYTDEHSYIVDRLPTHMKVSGDITLNGEVLTSTANSTTGAYYEYSENGKVLTIHLDKTRTGEQKIVYKTVFDGTVSKEDIAKLTNIVNEANFHFGAGNGHMLTKKADIHVGKALMSKKGTYDATTHRVTWQVTLTTDNQSFSELTLSDTFVQKVGNTTISQKYVPDSMYIINTEDGTRTPIALEGNMALTLLDDGKAFTLKITGAHPQHKILEYQTELQDIEGAGLEFWGNNAKQFTINNTIGLTAPELPPKAEVTGSASGTSTVLAKTVGSYNYKDKTIQWTLTVNQNKMKLTNGTIMDTLDDLTWEYDTSKGITVTQGKNKDQVKARYGTSEQGKPTMTISLPAMEAGDEPYVITYYTKLANPDSLLANVQLDAKNSATLMGDEINKSGVTVTASKKVGQDVLKKSLTKTLDVNNELTWTVDVNRNLATIKTTDDNARIGIVDTLQEGLSYVADSLKVYPLNIDENGNENKGNALTKDRDYTVTYDKAKRELQILWMSNELTDAYRLEFRTLVMVSKNYTNSVSFVGVIQDGWSSSEKVSAYAMFGGGYTSLPAALGELVIEKRDGTDTTKLLSGARFKIIDENDLTIGIFTTDSKGMITAVLPVGKYTIVEVGTPDKYAIEKQKVTTWTVIVKSQDRITTTIYNYLDKDIATYSPKVTKELKGRTTSTEKFTFKLEAVDNAPMPEKDTTVTLNGVTGVAETDTVSFGQIQYVTPGTYHYTITEEDGKASRYTYDTKPHTLTVTVAYDATGQLTATAKYDTDKDALTITNTYKKPSGGGSITPEEPKPDPVPPVDPVDPVEPDPDPDKPTEPTEPDQPTEPTDPDQPSQPDQPETPTTPTQPSRPNRPSIPQYPIDRLPDPSDPNSPDEIIIIDDDDVPLGNFYKEQEPDGSYAYVDKKGHMYGRTMPKGTKSSGRTPQTGVPMTVPALAITGGLCAVGGTVLWFGGKKKKDEA